MKALSFDRFGGPEVLIWRDLPNPQRGSGQALVRIHAAGLNFADIYRRQGKYHLAGSPPWILGYEGAGVVEAADPDSGFMAGNRVAFADSAFANAELVAVDADRLVHLPDAIDFETAAALLLQGLTAQYLSRDSFTIKPGHRVVIHAAAGGVGLLLCQLARDAGAQVIGIASSSEKRDAVQAHAVAAVPTENWADAVRAMWPDGAHVVYDSVGTTLPDSLKIARTGGTVVFYGMADGDPPLIDPRLLMDRSLTLTGGDLWNVLTDAHQRRSRAAELFAAVMGGRLDVRIAARMPIAQGAQAHRLMESRSVIGKIVLLATN